MKTVAISGARSLPALKIARALASKGIRVITTDSLASATAGVSRACHRYVRMVAPRVDVKRFAEEVHRLIEEEKPDLWIPTGEEIFYLARGREAQLASCPLFAPSFEQLVTSHHKHRFAHLAVKLGWGPKETLYLPDSGSVENLYPRSSDFVFKPVWSRGGERILVQPSLEQIRHLRPTIHDPWIAQTYLPGEEVSSYSVAWHGQLLAHAAYRPRHRTHHGAAIAFEPVEDAEAREFSLRFVEATRWHGQVGFDFRRDEDGRLLAIECNPRATSGIHLLGDDALVEAFSGRQARIENNSKVAVIGLAMMTYGLPSILKSRIGESIRDLTTGRDVLWALDDPAPFLQQFFFLWEAAQLARRRKISMHLAFTHDLEWDGAPISFE